MQYRSSFNNTPQHNVASARTLQRNPSGKLSCSPGNWKNYLPSDLVRHPEQSRTSYQSINWVSNPNNNSYSYHQQLGELTLAQRSQKQRKKQQILKRVKQVQDRVMPLIQNGNTYKQQQDISWKNKMQQKVAKLQTSVDAIQKSLQIKLQKQILMLQRKMMHKYAQIHANLGRNNQS